MKPEFSAAANSKLARSGRKIILTRKASLLPLRKGWKAFVKGKFFDNVWPTI